MLDENRWLAARHGLEAELLDPTTADAPRRARADRRAARRARARTPASSAARRELAGIEDLLRAGNGASRQRMVFEANHDLRELMAEIVATSAATP